MPLAGLEYSYKNDQVTSSNLYYLHSDHLNTPRLATNAAQKMLWNWNSDAYGVGQPNTDADGDGIALDIPLRFPGQQYDAQSGLNYNYFRDYDPSTGRYVQSDPIGLEGGLNTYGYVSGNPISTIDFWGLAGVGTGSFGNVGTMEIPQPVVNFSAGLGDALLLGTGPALREFSGVDGNVDTCSGAYSKGGWASFAFGGGRLIYAGAAKAGSVFAVSGVEASLFRQQLKNTFRMGAGKSWRPPNLEKYPTDQALRNAAGRTNLPVNGYGAGVVIAGGEAAICGCEN